MKRRILLLTAVVMIAVMLSGCKFWPFGKVNVTVELPEDAFEIVRFPDSDEPIKLTFEAKKRSEVILEAVYKVQDEPANVEWTQDGKELSTVVELKDENDEKVIGQRVSFTVPWRDTEIVAKVVEPEVVEP